MRNYLHKYIKLAKEQSKYQELENCLSDSVPLAVQIFMDGMDEAMELGCRLD